MQLAGQQSNRLIGSTDRLKLIGLSLLAAVLLAAIGYQASISGRDASLVMSVFATRFLGIFVEAVPFLLLGSITSGLIETFVKSDDIMRILPRNRLGAALGGAFLGLVFPVCECGVVPVARRLFSKGTPVSLGVAFLLAAPFMNPIVFASTFIAFGFGPVFIGRIIVTILVAVIVGVVLGSFAKPAAALKPIALGGGHDDHAHCEGETPSTRARLLDALGIAADEFFEMGRFLIFGSILAALMQTLIAQESLLALGTGPVFSVLFMQILAYVLSVCSTVDSFLALAFVNSFTTGAIVSFLSFGPMVDIKSTLMFTGVFRRRIVLYLILLPFVMNLLAGALINLMLGYA
ncbi:MAG: permease [Chloroflexota bacterium]|nr:permease [Chloroflexota bacterium]